MYWSLWSTHVILLTVQHGHFYHLFEKYIFFSWWRKFFGWHIQFSPEWLLCRCCSYELVGTWRSYTVIILCWCLKLFSIIINRNICNLILIVFWIFAYYFSMVSAGFSNTAAVVVYDSVLVDDKLNAISILFFLWHFEISTGAVRILVVLAGSFLFCF